MKIKYDTLVPINQTFSLTKPIKKQLVYGNLLWDLHLKFLSDII